jgi:creatinine amidohydrolase/Fe(II)-dependent formamide hydrolase-like protein
MSKYSIRIAEPTSSNFCSEHAGYEETSIMRYLYPYLLDSSYKSLPRVSSKRALKETGYIGEPSKATIDYGKRLFNELVELYVKAVINLRAGKLSSPPRRIRWLPLFLQHRL